MAKQTIINDEMTLEEKLAAIDAAMATALQAQSISSGNSSVSAPLDPADLTMCVSCQ